MRAAERPDRYRHPQVLIDFLQADILALEAERDRLLGIEEAARDILKWNRTFQERFLPVVAELRLSDALNDQNPDG